MTIRSYRNADAPQVGRLIAETFRRFNLSYAAVSEQEKLLGPFRYADSSHPDHRQRIAETILAPLVLVAEDESTGPILGVLRGSPGRLHSLFVHGDAHRRGIGRGLMTAFEDYVRDNGVDRITLQATLYAVPFYQRLGYKRSTGVRVGHCFEGAGFPYQPMKRTL